MMCGQMHIFTLQNCQVEKRQHLESSQFKCCHFLVEKSRREAWHWKIYLCYAVLEERLLLGIGEYGCTIPHSGTGILRGASRECSVFA